MKKTEEVEKGCEIRKIPREEDCSSSFVRKTERRRAAPLPSFALARFARSLFGRLLFFTRSFALLCESGNLRRPEKGRKGKVFFFDGDAVIVVVVVFVVMV